MPENILRPLWGHQLASGCSLWGKTCMLTALRPALKVVRQRRADHSAFRDLIRIRSQRNLTSWYYNGCFSVVKRLKFIYFTIMTPQFPQKFAFTTNPLRWRGRALQTKEIFIPSAQPSERSIRALVSASSVNSFNWLLRENKDCLHLGNHNRRKEWRHNL